MKEEKLVERTLKHEKSGDSILDPHSITIANIRILKSLSEVEIQSLSKSETFLNIIEEFKNAQDCVKSNLNDLINLERVKEFSKLERINKLPVPNETRVTQNGCSIEANYVDNKPEGLGIERWDDKTIYRGHFSSGVKNGKGILYLPNHDFYIGEFQNDKIEGFGEYQWHNKRYYKGEWRQGRMNGDGELVIPGVYHFKGSFLDDLKHGNGVLTLPNGDYINAIWCKDKIHGSGVYQKSGKIYTINWNYGKIVDFTFSRVSS